MVQLRLVDDYKIRVRCFGLRNVEASFLDAGGEIHADMETSWERLVVVDDLKLLGRLEDPGITE